MKIIKIIYIKYSNFILGLCGLRHHDSIVLMTSHGGHLWENRLVVEFQFQIYFWFPIFDPPCAVSETCQEDVGSVSAAESGVLALNATRKMHPCSQLNCEWWFGLPMQMLQRIGSRGDYADRKQWFTQKWLVPIHTRLLCTCFQYWILKTKCLTVVLHSIQDS